MQINKYIISMILILVTITSCQPETTMLEVETALFGVDCFVSPKQNLLICSDNMVDPIETTMIDLKTGETTSFPTYNLIGNSVSRNLNANENLVLFFNINLYDLNVFLGDKKTKEFTQLKTKFHASDNRIKNAIWGPNGNFVYFHLIGKGSSRIYEYSLKDNTTDLLITVKENTRENAAGAEPILSMDGNHILYAMPLPELQLMVLDKDLKSGEWGKGRVVLDSNCYSSAKGWVLDSNQIYYFCKETLFLIDIELNKVREIDLPSLITEHKLTFSFHFLEKDTFIFSVPTANQELILYTFDIKTEVVTEIANIPNYYEKITYIFINEHYLVEVGSRDYDRLENRNFNDLQILKLDMNNKKLTPFFPEQ